jgi:hypothetical protein
VIQKARNGKGEDGENLGGTMDRPILKWKIPGRIAIFAVESA